MALGLWVALVLLFVTQFVLFGSLSWRDAVVPALLFWGLWFLFMPAVVLLLFALPSDRDRRLKQITIHVLTCATVVVISQLVFRNFPPLPFPPPGAPPAGKLPANFHAPFLHAPPVNGFLAFRAGLDILIYWSLFGLCQGIMNFRRSQDRERRAAELEARLTRSKLQALRMQINPHFLFNTLNAISTLIYVNPKAADEMLGDLSELLRWSLDTEEQEISLARELEFIRAYVGIEQRRFGDRLKMEEDVPNELMQALVPALILQPLIENAIRHGIEPQRASSVINVQARRHGNTLHLTLHDNGKGPPVTNGGAILQGIGLSNTQARLRELYGTQQQFSFGKDEPRGCVVEVRLPFHTEPVQLASTSTDL